MPGLDHEQIEMWEYWHPEGPPSTAKKAKLRCYDPMDMVKEFAKVTGQTPSTELYLKLIDEEFEEWKEEWEPDLELKELSDLVYVIFGYANARGWDLMEAIRRVHQNNVGRCLQPDGTVHRREDGKILKNKDYPKVDLSDLV
jgi:predicted house-cleaning noncanonical NTP pyrophosphatase (MazG superfamily)